MPSPTGLLSLPYELLLQIVETPLPLSSLNALLRTSRALASLLTPALCRLASTTTLDYDTSVLLWSAERGYARTIASLIDAGSDIEAKDHTYKTPLIKATENGHLQVVRVLLGKGADIAANAGRYNDGGTALHVAARAGHGDIIELLLEHGANIEARASRGATPLHWAVEEEREDVVRLLLGRGADINAQRTYDCETPLKLTPENEGDGIFRLLLEKGADIDIQGRLKETVLLAAVAKERVEMVRVLLARGANVLSRNEYGETALHLAAVTYIGGDGIARLLLDRQEEIMGEPGYVDAQNDQGDTPLHLATRDERRRKQIEVGKVIRQIAEEKCGEMDIDPDGLLADPETAVINIQKSAEANLTALVRLLLEKGAGPNYMNALERTPLHNATANGYVEMTKLLLDHGAWVDVSDMDGRTPLFRAARVSWNVRRKPEESVGRIDVIRLLLEWGANPYHKDRAGGTIGRWTEGNQALVDLLGEDYDEVGDGIDCMYYRQDGEKALGFLGWEDIEDVTIKRDGGAKYISKQDVDSEVGDRY